jgi:hypothetical protein
MLFFSGDSRFAPISAATICNTPISEAPISPGLRSPAPTPAARICAARSSITPI